MKKLFSVRTIILAGNPLLHLGTLGFHSRRAVRTPRPANLKLNGRRAAFCIAALIAGLGLMPADQVTAQTFTTLHYFTGGTDDGASPRAGLILSGNTLYGTATSGGSSGNGAVFAVNTNGTGFTILHSFTAVPSSPFPSTNSDGVGPQAGLILSGNTLYGTALAGGSSGNGTVFAVNIDGTGFTNLYSFSGYPSDGANPNAELILSGNTLYGTTSYGGSSGVGTVFAVNTDGTGSTTLHHFTSGTDGSYPYAGLILSGTTLYGTTAGANSLGSGSVFAIDTDGTGFTNLHSFTSDSDGAYPYGRLILSGNTLYGTAYNGGNPGAGTVFAVNTDSTGFTNLHNFTSLTSGTNSDGVYPRAGLILSGNTLYGTAFAGGSSGNGTVFAVNTDGTGFTTLHSFTFSTDGAGPYSVILSGNTLYGTTSYYGSSVGYGTVFSLTLAPPQLTIENVLSEMSALRATVTNRIDGRQLDLAIKHLTRALAAELWEDETHLNRKHGLRVFHEDTLAAWTLCHSIQSRRSQLPDAVLLGFVDRILKADRLLATEAIDEAISAGASGKKIKQAQSYVASGDAKAAADKCLKSIADYSRAWDRAAHAKVSAPTP